MTVALIAVLSIACVAAAAQRYARELDGGESFTVVGGAPLISKYAFAASVAFECTGAAANLQPGTGAASAWRCLDGTCVGPASRCDGRQQCVDGSDEQHCPVVELPVSMEAQGQPAYASAPVAGPTSSCTGRSGSTYALDWKAEGSTFFQDWNYLQNEPNSGAAEYVDANTAYQEGLTAPYPDHAVIRPGGKGNYLKRKSVKIETRRKWTYFLMALKYEALPWGCGVWPALWTHSPEAGWPAGGELDILEYANEITSRSSLHVAESNRCQLNAALLNRPGCPSMPDAEYNFTGHYECVTAYPDKIGCAPNDRGKMLNGEALSSVPGVIAAEWTPEHVKIFRIPVTEMPADLASDAPRPDEWDQWLQGYYPFAESERTVPGSCPNPAGVLKAQQIVLSLGFCGDWASKVYKDSTCANKGYSSASPWSSKGPLMDSQCVAVDPHDPKGEQPAGPRDCCTRFIYDEDGTYGADEYLMSHGFWKINWLKVYQSGQFGRARRLHEVQEEVQV